MFYLNLAPSSFKSRGNEVMTSISSLHCTNVQVSLCIYLSVYAIWDVCLYWRQCPSVGEVEAEVDTRLRGAGPLTTDW